MTGPKLNEKSFVAGERSGTKATARYVRASASKARVVLDLIRGLDVVSADQVLQFTDRHIARDVRKVLASAVANAVNNDGQDADELLRRRLLRRRGPDAQAFPPPCPWPCDTHQQALEPHHRDRRPHERSAHRRHPGPPGACRWHRRSWSPAVERRQPSCPRRAQPRQGRPGGRSRSSRDRHRNSRSRRRAGRGRHDRRTRRRRRNRSSRDRSRRDRSRSRSTTEVAETEATEAERQT